MWWKKVEEEQKVKFVLYVFAVLGYTTLKVQC